MARQTDAERYRRARENFELARELGLSCPAEAERERRKIEARERHRAAADRLAAKMNAPLVPGSAASAAAAEWDAPWMQRN